jgi:hypothetical protein
VVIWKSVSAANVERDSPESSSAVRDEARRGDLAFQVGCGIMESARRQIETNIEEVDDDNI